MSFKGSDQLLDAAYVYLLKKLYLISVRYKPYQATDFQFIHSISSSEDRYGISNKKFDVDRLRKLVKKLKQNPSHITTKLIQAINFIRHFEFYKRFINKTLNISEFARELNGIRNPNESLITLIPPSFFKVEISFKDSGKLSSLSSGEKQRMYTASSWVYHLLNLISVKEDASAGYISYQSVNIVFDEIELYYHPEMQRTFLQDFIESLNTMNLPTDMRINCLFITHSPFILSDIPNTNILFLTETGVTDEIAKDHRTFGANIHELLQNNFFLAKGTMGEFVRLKIQGLIEYLNDGSVSENSWTKDSADKMINLISEPVLRKSLRELYKKKFGQNKTELERQLALIQKELLQYEAK